MSLLVLNRNYQLQLPNSFVKVDKEEIDYIDGGATFKDRWYGWDLNLSAEECRKTGKDFDRDGATYEAITRLFVNEFGINNIKAAAISGVLGAIKVGNMESVARALTNCADNDTGATLIYQWGVYGVNPW